MAILPYSSSAFQKAFKDRFLQEMSHTRYNSGPINDMEVTNIINFMNNEIPNNIKFKLEKIPKELEGGACSALGLRFCYYTLKLMETYPEDKIREKIIDYIKNLESFRKKKNKIQKDFRLRIRNIQAAFNTITVVNKDDPDICIQKVQAIASFYGLTAKKVTEEVDITHAFSDQIVARQTDKLEPGVYLIRIIKPPAISNDKEEECGHTLPFIKLGVETFFLDVNLGLFSSNKEIIFNVLTSAYVKWPCNKYTIYKMELNGRVGFETTQYNNIKI